jgi:hypothetical protein
LGLLALLVLVYLLIVVRSLTPVTANDTDLYISSYVGPVQPDSAPAQANAVEQLQSISEELWWPNSEVPRIQSDLLSATNWDATFADQMLQKNEAALAIWAKAESASEFMLPETKLGDDLSFLRDWKTISRLLIIKEKFLCHAGQNKEAFDTMIRHFRFGQRVADSHGPFIVYLVGLAISHQALDTIRQSLTATNLVPDDLNGFIRRLDSETKNGGEVYANTVKSEYQADMRMLNALHKGELVVPDVQNSAIKPRWWWPTCNYSETKALFADYSSSLLKNATNHFDQFKAPAIAINRDLASLILSGNIAGRVMYAMLTPATTGIFEKKCNADVQIQATRTLMALRSYQLAHGRLPDDLAALAPEFLNQVPVDDFNGQPLHYSVTNKIVYSVGKNLKDDGGDDRGQEEWNTSQRHLDIVFELNF